MNLGKNKYDLNKWVGKLLETSQDPNPKPAPQEEKHVVYDPNLQTLLETKINSARKLIDYNYPAVASSRAIGEWRSELNLVFITDVCDSSITANFRLANAKGNGISNWDALLLLETDKLEIFENGIPWTVSHAYRTFLKNSQDIDEYRNYRNVALEKCFMVAANSASTKDSALKKFYLNPCHKYRGYSNWLKGVSTSGDTSEVYGKLKEIGPKRGAPTNKRVRTLTKYGFTDKYCTEICSTASYFKRDAVGIRFQPIEALPTQLTSRTNMCLS